MWGLFFAILAGLAISFQNILNTRVSNSLGTLGTATLVHFVGFLTCCVIVILTNSFKDFKSISELPIPYLFGGVVGVIIIFSIIKSINFLGASYAIAVMILIQILFSLFADTFGLFGLDKIPLSPGRIMGVILLIGGAFLFQLSK